MADNSEKILKKITPSRVFIPMIIGIGIVVYLLAKEWKPGSFSLIEFSWYTVLLLLAAFVLMGIRDFGYMVRLKILSEGELTWKQVFNIIMLWEFASAVTPSAVGGTSVAVLFIYKEGVNLGRSTAIVLATSILDEFYFLLMFPLVFFLVGSSDLFTIGGETLLDPNDVFSNRYFYFAVIGYSIKFVFVCFVFYGLFFNPHAIKRLLAFIFRLPFLKRWRNGAIKTGDDLITASAILKKKSFVFWLKTFGATLLSWTARYWVVNMLILALVFGIPDFIQEYLMSAYEHILIFARQLVMWIMMLVMPSPGGSGFAEAVFTDYLGEFIPAGFVALMALLWRIVTYYPYLFIGTIILPRWVKRVFTKQ